MLWSLAVKAESKRVLAQLGAVGALLQLCDAERVGPEVCARFAHLLVQWLCVRRTASLRGHGGC